jgi:hypothetical protein
MARGRFGSFACFLKPLVWRQGVQRKGVHGPSEFLSQKLVYPPVTADEPLIRKLLGYDGNLEM